MENINFTDLINKLKLNTNFESLLPQITNRQQLKIFNISNLNTDDIVLMFTKIQKKFYSHHPSHEQFWHQNELRIFIWLLFAYLHVYQHHITDLKQEDWNYFSNIFNEKNPIFFEYQTKLLIKDPHSPWTIEETKLLQDIIEQKDNKNQWNSIARDLYIQSNKTYLRNPKQCRQRWKNHLDPAKIHSKWTQTQDLALLQCIHKHGRKWSKTVKELNETRTEHMVKNRYKSLTSALNKRHRGRKTPEQVQLILINKITKSLNKKKKQLEIVKPEEEEIDSPKNILKTTKSEEEIFSEDNLSKYSQENNKKQENCFDMNCSESISYQFNSHPEIIRFKIDQGIMPSKFYQMDDERIFLHEDYHWKDTINNQHIFKM